MCVCVVCVSVYVCVSLPFWGILFIFRVAAYVDLMRRRDVDEAIDLIMHICVYTLFHTYICVCVHTAAGQLKKLTYLRQGDAHLI